MFKCVWCVLLFMCNDPYDEFRDESGRFIKGNPGGSGRPRGSYSWLSGEELVRKYPWLLVSVPSPCPECGCGEFRYSIQFDAGKEFSVRCKCNGCNECRVYNSYSDKWGSI